MTGKRLLDLAALFKASREIAYKHVELRQSQWSHFFKTSSLTRDLRGGSAHINGSNIPKRGPAISKKFSTLSRTAGTRNSESDVPSPKNVESEGSKLDREGLKQDHFYTRSKKNATLEHPPSSKLGVKQEKAATYPLPDGTIPPSGASPPQVQAKEELSAPLSQTTVWKRPLNETNQKESPDFLVSGGSSIPNPEQALADHNRQMQRQAERQIPSEVAKPPPTTASDPDIVGNAEPSSPALTVDQEQDVFYSPESASGKVLSALPRVKVPKTSEAIQEGDPHVPDEQLNQDVFYSSADPKDHVPSTVEKESPLEEDLSEEQYSELSHSPKIKNLLRRNLESTERNLPDPKSPWHRQKRSFATFRKAQMPRNEPISDVKDLAADIAKDAEASAKASTEVSTASQLQKPMLIS